MPIANPERWRNKYVVQPDGCWKWTGSLDRHGYGQFDVHADGKRKNWRAHRWVYEQLVGPIPGDLPLDHLCRNHACVNPDHLEAVSHAENVRRGLAGLHNAVKTHCPKGHAYDDANTILLPKGGRGCRECSRTASRLAQRKARGTAPDAVNNRDKTHCKHGHEFTPENTIKTKNGRNCRECTRKSIREYMRRKRAMT